MNTFEGNYREYIGFRVLGLWLRDYGLGFRD